MFHWKDTITNLKLCLLLRIMFEVMQMRCCDCDRDGMRYKYRVLDNGCSRNWNLIERNFVTKIKEIINFKEYFVLNNIIKNKISYISYYIQDWIFEKFMKCAEGLIFLFFLIFPFLIYILYYIASHDITLHYITSHYITLHHIILHYKIYYIIRYYKKKIPQ